jgi:hypothetical protein
MYRRLIQVTSSTTWIVVRQKSIFCAESDTRFVMIECRTPVQGGMAQASRCIHLRLGEPGHDDVFNLAASARLLDATRRSTVVRTPVKKIAILTAGSTNLASAGSAL